MTRTVAKVLAVCMIGCFTTVLPCRGDERFNADIQAYVLGKFSTNDIVLMGTTHKQPAILNFMAGLVPRLRIAGVTHLALEITSDQQTHLDRFLTTGRAVESIALHEAIDCPSYRDLLGALQHLPPDRRPRVIAIDLPKDRYGGSISRDEYMAGRLADTLRRHPHAKILAMLGSLHVLRKLQWHRPSADRHQALRTYLSLRRPDLKIFSMVHLLSMPAGTGDLSGRLGTGPDMVALDVDSRVNGWHLGLTACLAVRPSRPDELVDGVIVHPGAPRRLPGSVFVQ
jgi:hypothetical protein